MIHSRGNFWKGTGQPVGFQVEMEKGPPGTAMVSVVQDGNGHSYLMDVRLVKAPINWKAMMTVVFLR